MFQNRSSAKLVTFSVSQQLTRSSHTRANSTAYQSEGQVNLEAIVPQKWLIGNFLGAIDLAILLEIICHGRLSSSELCWRSRLLPYVRKLLAPLAYGRLVSTWSRNMLWRPLFLPRHRHS